MSQFHLSDAGVSSAQGEGFPQYRPMSRLAVVSLLLALLSAIALIHPLLWAAPAAAAAAAVAALRTVRADQPSLAGRKTALCALALACLFAGWAPAQHFARRQALYEQAAFYAQQWFHLVREGRMEEAFELHMPWYMRRSAGVSLKEFYAKPTDQDLRAAAGALASPTAYGELTAFFNAPPLDKLVANRRNGRIDLESNRAQHIQSDGAIIVQHYLFRYREGGQSRTLPIELVFRRAPTSPRPGFVWDLQAVNRVRD